MAVALVKPAHKELALLLTLLLLPLHLSGSSGSTWREAVALSMSNKAYRHWRDGSNDCQLGNAANPHTHLKLGGGLWLEPLRWLAASEGMPLSRRSQHLLQVLAQSFKMGLVRAQLLGRQQPAQLLAAVCVPAADAQPRLLQEVHLQPFGLLAGSVCSTAILHHHACQGTFCR